MLTLRGRAVFLAFGLQFGGAGPVCAALESGVYQTLPGATVVEQGDRVTNGIRTVPISATMNISLVSQPSLTATIPNAVLEGGAPFPLTVHSYYGALFTNQTYHFRGDYLRELYPSGTQYLFDWYVSPATNGQIVWKGITGWAGGHLWQITVSNLTLVPVPWLTISQTGLTSVEIAWVTNFADYVLEYTTDFTAAGWTAATNSATTNGNRISVASDFVGSPRFYRLRKP